MITASSRYKEADQETVNYHGYTETGSVDLSTDKNPILYAAVTTYLLTVPPLPDPPTDTYMVRATEHMSFIAHMFYGDSKRWWVIADANPQVRYPLDLAPGSFIGRPT